MHAQDEGLERFLLSCPLGHGLPQLNYRHRVITAQILKA